MSDDLKSRFLARRPLLESVANALHRELSSLFADRNMAAAVVVAVISDREFDRQIQTTNYAEPLSEMSGQIVAKVSLDASQDATTAQQLIAEVIKFHSVRLDAYEDGESPSVQATCVIPPHVLPPGWRTRTDVPAMFELTMIRKETGDHVASPAITEVVKRPPLALIMKGGGIKGLAYVGAMEILERHYRFNWFVGTSAGAITAVLLGAGFTPEELKGILAKKDFRDFFDAPRWRWIFNLVAYQGVHPGETFTQWLDSLLAEKLGSITRVTLSKLPHRVTVYAARRGKRTLEFDSTKQSIDAAYAARCSMSIPVIFIPEREQGIFTWDGGLHQNYPVKQLLDAYPGTPFISLYLGSEVFEPRSSSVLWDPLVIWTEGDDADVVEEYRQQTVIIDTRPIRTLDFGLTDVEKEFLVACGRAAALTHVSKGSHEHVEAVAKRDELRSRVQQDRSERQQRAKLRRLRYGLILFLVLFGGWLASLFAKAGNAHKVPTPEDMLKFDVFHHERRLDLTQWQFVPDHRRREKVSPTYWTDTLRVRRLDETADQYCIRHGTTAEVAPEFRSPTHQRTVFETSESPVGGDKLVRRIFDVCLHVQKQPINEYFDLQLESKYWNASNDPQKAWCGLPIVNNTKSVTFEVRFPKHKPPTKWSRRQGRRDAKETVLVTDSAARYDEEQNQILWEIDRPQLNWWYKIEWEW